MPALFVFENLAAAHLDMLRSIAAAYILCSLCRKLNVHIFFLLNNIQRYNEKIEKKCMVRFQVSNYFSRH